MKKLLKPACIGLYLLMLLFFFVVGLYYADITDAGKNQGLAGGAIVLGYGVMFAGLGFVASFFMAYFMNLKYIKILNWVLLIAILSTWAYKFYQFQQRDKDKPDIEEELKPKPVSAEAEAVPVSATMRIGKRPSAKATQPVGVFENGGMGFFTPNFYENNTLYFYGNLNLEKSLMDHSPYDSITFKRNQYNQFEIATAPPWLVPDHLKLDYDMLYFRVMSVTEEFVEVLVNTTNGQTSWVSKRAGKIALWPDFLLGVHSVEFPPGSAGKVKSKGMEQAGEVNTPYQFMKPIRIKSDWMEVLLIDGDYKKVGKGWIRWKKDGELLVMYNLLS